MGDVIATPSNIKIPDTSKWELLKSPQAIGFMKILNKHSSGMHSLVLLSNKRIPNVNFVGIVPNLSGQKKLKKSKCKKLLFERIIRILNEARDTRFPEIIDLTTVLVSGLEIPMLVTELITGTNLYKAMKTYYFSKNIQQKGSSVPLNLRRIREILLELVNLEEHLMKIGVAHVGLFPEHVIVQIDDIVKVTGYRFLIGIENGFIEDKPILQSKFYGGIVHRRYTEQSFQNYFLTKGAQRTQIEPIISYQIGMLLFDILTTGSEIDQDPSNASKAVNNALELDTANYIVSKKALSIVQEVLYELIVERQNATIKKIKETLSSLPD